MPNANVVVFAVTEFPDAPTVTVEDVITVFTVELPTRYDVVFVITFAPILTCEVLTTVIPTVKPNASKLAEEVLLATCTALALIEELTVVFVCVRILVAVA